MLMTTPKAHTLHIHALAKNVPSFTDALTLLRVWANQRGYGLGSRMCVRGFEGKGMWWASILDLIVNGEEQPPAGLGKRGARRKPLGKGLSSYQLFKAALDFLGMFTSTLGTLHVVNMLLSAAQLWRGGCIRKVKGRTSGMFVVLPIRSALFHSYCMCRHSSLLAAIRAMKLSSWMQRRRSTCWRTSLWLLSIR